MSNLDLLILQLFQQSDKVELAWVGLAQAQDLAAVRYCIQIQTVSELVQQSNRQANSIPLQMYKSIGLWKVELSSEKLTLYYAEHEDSAQHMGSESHSPPMWVKIRTLVFDKSTSTPRGNSAYEHPDHTYEHSETSGLHQWV